MTDSKNGTPWKKIGVGAGAALLGGLLLAGGSSSLWSDSAEVAGGSITAGNLDIEALETGAQDVSPDRADSPHDIDLSTWRAVPGDVVAIQQTVDIALEGDNLVAELNTDALEAAIPESAQQYVTFDLEVTDADGEVVEPDTDGGYRFVAPRDGQEAGIDAGAGKVVGSTLDGTADATATVTVTFSADTPDQVLTETQLADLAGGGVELLQVRDGAGFN